MERVITIFRLTALAISCLALTGCSTSPIKVNGDYDRGANFTTYRSFGWISADPLVLADPTTNPLF